MKIWLAKNSEVPLHEQLVAQITLGIASNDLKVGERLPSTRELARRFKIHQNTVSTAYRELAAKGLVTFKKGSGVFVTDGENGLRPTLDALYTEFLGGATRHGYSQNEIRRFIDNTYAARPAKRFLIVESDIGLREIVAAEVQQVTGLRMDGIAFEELSEPTIDDDTQIVAMADERNKIEPLLQNKNCLFINSNSVASSMSGEAAPSPDHLIAIVSGWGKFITFAKLYLIAANIDPSTVIERSTTTADWKRGLEQAAMIICDSLTAAKLGNDRRVRMFPLISPSSIGQLKRLST